jgi:hypothetical protein
VTPGGESPTGPFEGIGTPIQTGDTEMGGAGRIGAVNGAVAIKLMSRTALAIATAVKPLECNGNGKRLRSGGSDSLRAPSDWRSRMERSMQQQAQELTQSHRTVGHLANLLEAQVAHEEAQWLAMMLQMQARDQKRDAFHKDDMLRGAGSTNMIAKLLNGIAPGEQEKAREKTARMDGGGLEALQHADTTQKGV